MSQNLSRKLFVNLAVSDLAKSVEFFTKLGFAFNQQFTDENTACMILSEEAFVMLQSRSRFQDFTKKPISDATAATEGVFGLSARSRAEVDEMVQTAIAAGGTHAADAIDHGFMYSWGFCDPDGHQWGVVWMDPAVIAR